MATSGISLGDVVLHFRADVTSLNQSVQQVGAELPAKLAPSGEAVDNLGASFADIAPKADAAGRAGERAGQQMAQGARTAGSEYHKAYAEISLVGELTGVTLPRHVRTFLAALPGVGAAMSAAFSATAIFFLIEALTKGAEKLSTWISDTFIFTAAQKALNAELINSNLVIKKYNEQLDILRREYELIGASGSLKDALELKFQVQDRDKLTSTMRDVQNDIAAINRGWRTSTELIPAVNHLIAEMHQDLKEADLKKLFLPNSADREQVLGAFNDILGQLQKQNAVFQQKILNQTKQGNVDKQSEDEKAAAIAQRLAEQRAKIQQSIEEKMLKGIVAAHEDLTATFAKQAVDQEKINEFRLKEELKGEEAATTGILQQLRVREEAALATVDAQTEELRAKYEQQARLYKTAYDVGAMNGQDYLARIRELYDAEVAELQDMLNQKEQLVILEAQNEAAMRGAILSDADAMELAAYIDLETQKEAIQHEFANRYLALEDRVTQRIARNFHSIIGLLDEYSRALRAQNVALQGWGKVADGIIGDVSESFGRGLEAWAAGQESFGEAMRQAFQQYLAQVAGKAAIDALYFLAWGIADTFWNPPRAAADFAAAAEFGAIAAVAGGLAKSMGGGGGHAGGGSSGPSGPGFVSTQQPEQQPVQERNTLSFAGGGLVTRRTLAIIGDAGIGSQREAVIPLGNDSKALDEIAGRIMERMPEGRTIHNHFNIDGVISADNLHKVMARMNREINAGTVRLNASNSTRLTRRS